MRAFSYADYLFYRGLLGESINYEYLNDVSEKYILDNRQKTYSHDHIFKRILNDKKEAVDFINERLKLENTEDFLQVEDIEEYNREFITYNFDNMQSDVIYKIKNRKVFFLIEHQSTIDYAMPYRILKYNIAIMDSAVDKTKVRNKNYRLPLIFSFVIYTGNKKWDAGNYILEKQEKFGNCEIGPFANFQVVDINEYSEENLLNKNTVLSVAMLLEKTKDIDDFLQKIMQKNMNSRQKSFLIQFIQYILKNRGNKKDVKNEKIIEKLKEYLEILKEKKEGGKLMFVEVFNNWLDEMIEKEEYFEERKEYFAQKEKSMEQKEKNFEQKEKNFEQKEKSIEQKEKNFEQREKTFEKKEKSIRKREKEIEEKEKKLDRSRKDIVLRMLKSNIDDSTILKLVDIKKSELIKIKEENNMAVTN